MNKFPNVHRTYKDTKNCGGISVRGFVLESDGQGFIEAPADLAVELEPHGFVPMERPVTQTITARK